MSENEIKPIDVECHAVKCGAKVGEKCINYKGRHCAPHSRRVELAAEKTSLRARIDKILKKPLESDKLHTYDMSAPSSPSVEAETGARRKWRLTWRKQQRELGAFPNNYLGADLQVNGVPVAQVRTSGRGYTHEPHRGFYWYCSSTELGIKPKHGPTVKTLDEAKKACEAHVREQLALCKERESGAT